jgi:hypothetical protein
MSQIRFYKGDPVTALFRAFGRDIGDIFRNPLAFLGGLGGMTATCLLLYLGFAVFAGDANAEDEDELLIDFTPGTLVKLGEKIEDKELPEKIIVQETREEEETVKETVTEDEEAKAREEPPEPDDKEKKPDKPPPKIKKDKKLPTSKLPTKKNTPFNDLPTVDVNKGDPFGDPRGWDDLKKDGDPWATSVMAALNNMPVGTFAAKAKTGDFQFQLTICKDGSVKRINRKGGSLPPDVQTAIELELERLKLPKPPSKVAAKMGSSCAKINYTFRWSASGVK